MRKITVVFGVIFMQLLATHPISAQEVDPSWNFTEARQFDFWIGEWQVQNRFKQEDNSWKDEGGAQVKIFPVLGGKAVMEFWSGTARDMKETKGFSLRYFDTDTEKWKLALNWPQPNNGGFFFLDGEFRHNRGEFFSEFKNQQGEPVMNRYTFADVSDSTLRWNDGISTDAGKTWKTAWIMEFSRTGDQPKWPSHEERFHTNDNNNWNTTVEGKRFDQLVGHWQGESVVQSPNGAITKGIEMKVWRVLNGSSLLLELKGGGDSPFKAILMLTYREMIDMWLLLALDNRKETDFVVSGWKVSPDKPVFEEFTGGKGGGVALTLNELSEDKIDLTQTDPVNKTTVNLQLAK